jgi:hypothetical protein
MIRLTPDQFAAHQARVKRPSCEECGTQFYASPSQISRGGGRFCSLKCRGIWSSRQYAPTLIFVACAKCGKRFKRAPSQVKGVQNHFCSTACSGTLPRRSERKPCEHCGKKLTPVRGAKYCSVPCRAAAQVGVPIQEWSGGDRRAVCAGCGKEYVAKPSTKGLVCSLACWGKIKTSHMETRSHTRARGGKREDLGGQYFRSAWEANWARYLNWLIDRGELLDWKFEPDTFEFPVKRGARFYTPDFKLFERGGKVHYHEIKGWMDPASATKLRRMRLHHPDVSVTVIDQPAYRAVALQMRNILPGWERVKGHVS